MRLFSCPTFKEKARLVLPNKVLSSTCSYFKSPWIGSRSSFQERGEGVFSFCAGGHKGSDPPWWLLLPASTGEGACKQILQKFQIILDSLGEKGYFWDLLVPLFFCYSCATLQGLLVPFEIPWGTYKSSKGPSIQGYIYILWDSSPNITFSFWWLPLGVLEGSWPAIWQQLERLTTPILTSAASTILYF